MSSSGITHIKRPRDSPEFWLTEAKACGDPGCFTGPPHTWLRRVFPQVISTWGSKSSLHCDTQISAKNRIRMLLAIARSSKFVIGRERSLFMAGVGAEEKLFFLFKNTLPNHLLLIIFFYPTMFQVFFFLTQPPKSVNKKYKKFQLTLL